MKGRNVAKTTYLGRDIEVLVKRLTLAWRMYFSYCETNKRLTFANKHLNLFNKHLNSRLISYDVTANMVDLISLAFIQLFPQLLKSSTKPSLPNGMSPLLVLSHLCYLQFTPCRVDFICYFDIYIYFLFFFKPCCDSARLCLWYLWNQITHKTDLETISS
jgi:hypothetical protein